jgi:GT2 family glycosyltransferase
MTTQDPDTLLARPSRENPAWCMFDHTWYVRAYPGLPEGVDPSSFEVVRQYYLDHGRHLGHAPNMYVDEAWYRLRYPDVDSAVAAGLFASGYEHYCRIGYVNRSPHWLFDDPLYALYSPDVTDRVLVEQGCLNRYDHYIRAGARQGRIAHLLFDPATYGSFAERAAESEAGSGSAFDGFLRNMWTRRQEATTSVYFDANWYLAQHEQARAALKRGDYACALHHYLASPDAAANDPRKDFSEHFYRGQNPELAAAITAGTYRSGFEQFLKAGAFELRAPSADIDLKLHLANHPTAREAIDGGVIRDAFAHVVVFGYCAEPPPAPEMPAAVASPAAPACHGYVDFLGFHKPAHGWMFSGWLNPDDALLNGKVQAVAKFTDGQLDGPALLSTHVREDLAGTGVGVVVFVAGTGRLNGSLASLTLQAGPMSWTLVPAAGAAVLRDEALAVPLRQVTGKLLPNASKAAIVALAGRRGYSGANTLGALHDRVFMEIDETIFCPPDGVVLAGWMLARPGTISAIRLHSGGEVATLQPEQFLRIERPDVLKSVGTQHGFQDLRNGFIAFVPGMFQPGETTFIEVETARGEIGFRGITEPKLHGMPAMRFLLERFDVRYDEVRHVFDNVVGPAVASLNRDRLRDRGDHQVVDFGVQPGAPELSVIVPLYGRLDFMEYQFGFLSRHEPALAREIIYVLDDPGKTREAEVLAASLFARFRIPFRLVLLPRNLGYAPANNAGLELARGKYVCFLNSDVFPDSDDWMERLVARMRADAKLGAVGPMLLFEDRSVQHMGMLFEPLPEFANWLFPMHERKGWQPPARRGLRRCAAITGACMIVERSVLGELGGLDESFAIGDFEDSDLCMKLAERGLDCAVDLDVSMFHLERQSQAGSEQRWRMNLTLYNAWVHESRWARRLSADAALKDSQAA